MTDDQGRVSVTCDTHTAHKSDDGRNPVVIIARRGQDGRSGKQIGKVKKFSEAIELILEDRSEL